MSRFQPNSRKKGASAHVCIILTIVCMCWGVWPGGGEEPAWGADGYGRTGLLHPLPASQDRGPRRARRHQARALTTYSPLTPHLLLTYSPLTPHLLPTDSPLTPHYLNTTSPLPHQLLTNYSPLPHYYLTAYLPRTHHLLTQTCCKAESFEKSVHTVPI